MKFLGDENLRDNLNICLSEDFLHVTKIENSIKEASIWSIAKKNYSIILIKDTDFHETILYRTPPPKVILFKQGNTSVSFLQRFLKRLCEEIENEIEFAKLVIVYLDKIKGLK